jgi:hypothetical protein
VLVNPTRSANSTVTVLRSSPALGAIAASAAPQNPQKANPFGLSFPQAGQAGMRRV